MVRASLSGNAFYVGLKICVWMDDVLYILKLRLLLGFRLMNELNCFNPLLNHGLSNSNSY